MTAPVEGLPPRPAAGHKGDFGTMAIVGGCHSTDAVMLGAPVLAARAALRTGCGGAHMHLPGPLAVDALMQLCEATFVPRPDDIIEARDRLAAATCDAMVIGPGLGTGDDEGALVEGVLANAGPPTVVDADALNALAASCTWQWPASRAVVLTPHPGEYARLAVRLALPSAGDSSRSRLAAAVALAQSTHAVVVLKGYGTVVAAPDRQPWVCDRGGPELAVPGSGDVLAGILAAVIALRAKAGLDDLFEASKTAVWLHALAGERHARDNGPCGMLASELADQVPHVLKALQ
ncbi:MAG: NAD(P)H-hydrate dehydratase [Phycisphaerales bacterium]|nr:NAD(P)H-hydrate dehydratase [Phycisphaerales bacterium]